MSLLIANQVKQHIHGLFQLNYLCLPMFLTYATITTTITACSLFLSAYNLFVSHTCELFFSYIYSIFCSQHFCKHLLVRSSQRRSLNTEPHLHTTLTELLLTSCPLCLAFLYMHAFSLKVEGLSS